MMTSMTMTWIQMMIVKHVATEDICCSATDVLCGGKSLLFAFVALHWYLTKVVVASCLIAIQTAGSHQ